jgi:MFS family permease
MHTYLTLLSENRNYRNLWLGAVVSQLGDWFNLIASASLIATLTNSGTAVSYLFLARFLPYFFFSPIAGVLVDRYDRRRLMIVSDLLRALTVLGFLLVREPGHIWLLYLLTVVQFMLSTLFVPARTAVLPTVINPGDLLTANVLDSFTWSAMLALGALLGGLTAALFGLATAFILDALTFLLSAWFINRLVIPARAPALPGAQVSGWLDFVDGLRYLRGQRFILAISLAKGLGSLAWGAINVFEITFAQEVFATSGGATAVLGIIYAVSGIGTGLGPVILRYWLGDSLLRLRWGITIGFAFMVTGIFWLSLAPNFPLFTAGTLIRTAGTGIIWVFSAALLQTLVPDQVRGRVFAFEFAFLTLTQSFSILWAGLAQDTLRLSVWEATFLTGVIGVVTSFCWLVFHLAYLRYPADAGSE